MSIRYKRAGVGYITFRRFYFWLTMGAIAIACSVVLGYFGTQRDRVEDLTDQVLDLQDQKRELSDRLKDKDAELDRARGYYDGQVSQTVLAWSAAARLLNSSEWHAEQSGTWKARTLLSWKDIGRLKDRVDKLEHSWPAQVKTE